MSRRAARMAGVGFVGGLAAGLVLWSMQVHQHRRNLFSRNSYRRLLALSYLGATPSVETARLLRDYIAWEQRPLLRRRGVRILRQLERHLD
ncbi:MAG TPA: hypothetical protein VHQ45_01545 [Gemmatimonadaceae bacterium]|nr:hypothetical protein [Gemmatimonadaceae bacterium]